MRDLFDRQMEITDELIDRRLPTHVTPNSSIMEKRRLITKAEPTATGEQVAWNQDQDGNVVTGWMPVSDAKEIARRWNMHDDLMETLSLCSAELFAQCYDNPRAKAYVDQARKLLSTTSA